MPLRPRLLPTVAVAATMLLGFKVADIILGEGATVAPQALAQPASPPQPSAQTAPKQEPSDGHAGGDSLAATPSTKSATTVPPLDPQGLTSSEIEVLQQLSQRRASLDQRSSEIDQREVLLQAAEKRIDEKIAKLQDLQKGIERDVQKRSSEDDVRLQSLVKIYEAMKPKDAAPILEQLDMPVLLSVVQRMKELKTAAILAAMDPVKAKMLTNALAAKRGNDSAPTAARTPAGAPAPKL